MQSANPPTYSTTPKKEKKSKSFPLVLVCIPMLDQFFTHLLLALCHGIPSPHPIIPRPTTIQSPCPSTLSLPRMLLEPLPRARHGTRMTYPAQRTGTAVQRAMQGRRQVGNQLGHATTTTTTDAAAAGLFRCYRRGISLPAIGIEPPPAPARARGSAAAPP